MFRWIADVLEARRKRQRAAGKAWAQQEIKDKGVDAVHERLEADFAMGWPPGDWEAGALEAVREASEQPR